jgi:hypothetical protein
VMCVLFGNGVGQDHASSLFFALGRAGRVLLHVSQRLHTLANSAMFYHSRGQCSANRLCAHAHRYVFKDKPKDTQQYGYSLPLWQAGVLLRPCSLHCSPMCLSVPRSLTHFVNPLLWQAGNYSDAVSSLLELQKQDPSDAKIKHNLAVAQMCVAPRSRSCLAPVGLVSHRAFPHACRLVGLVSHRALHHA